MESPKPSRSGRVQLALLRGLEEHRYDFWKQYYVSSDRLTQILLLGPAPPLPTSSAGGSSDAMFFESPMKSPLAAARPAPHGTTSNCITDRFIGVLDDEVDKAVVFFLDQQGQIARDLWSMWKCPLSSTSGGTAATSTGQQQQGQPRHKKTTMASASQQLHDHALHLLRLVKFVDLNNRLVERLLSLHDEVIFSLASDASIETASLYPMWQQQRPRSIQASYLAGKVGREANAPHDHRRLSALLQPDSLRATVGITATVYYRYIKKQAKLHNKVNDLGCSLNNVPSMNNLAYFLDNTFSNSSNIRNMTKDVIREELDHEIDKEHKNEDEDDMEPVFEICADDIEVEETDEGDSSMPAFGDMRMLALTERIIQRPSVASLSAYSLGKLGDHLVGGVLLQIDTAMAKLNRTSSMMECLALPDLASSREESFVSAGRASTDDLRGLDEVLNEHEAMVTGAVTSTNIKTRQYSSWLNLTNSFLYMVSYYLVAPTSSAYATRLGLEESMSGAIIGMTAFSALASTVLYSWWTSHSYKHALIFSSICCLLGNLVYSAGLPFDSLTLVLVGRFLNGFGSARAINRRFIADAFSRSERTRASADFVASGAAGMSVGPGLAAIMPLLIPKRQQGRDAGHAEHTPNLWWQEENAAGWVMAGLWLVYLAFLIPYFQDPPKPRASAARNSKKHPPIKTTAMPTLESLHIQHQNGEQKPLIPKSLESFSSQAEEETSLLKRPAALVTIFLVFLLKLVLELVLSAAAPLTRFYFGWDPSTTGWFLAALGLLVLPAISFVTFLSKTFEDRRLILYSVVGTLVGCVLVIQYKPPSYDLSVYMLGTIILFVFPNTMEAPTMSLLSKNIPSSLSRGLFNLGFFTTEAGFTGRVVADSVLTWCGSQGTEHLVNSVFGFLTALTMTALALICYNMKNLVDPAKKYE